VDSFFRVAPPPGVPEPRAALSRLHQLTETPQALLDLVRDASKIKAKRSALGRHYKPAQHDCDMELPHGDPIAESDAR
jgi:hypothetical protein